ncbi:CdaR family transcriptional regulator [Rhodococcus sp. 114MFTsu3.1]|uniref:CdaR family transcriptional regulator n=1 Tax=Rhodococcus sp. 114MFTsu3.1 TaxID=1172184 RepID=UPI00035D107A|nr:sugar diacid recognition domain-containing protein [Rhodococcus sp. 114MFTsu3.1]
MLTAELAQRVVDQVHPVVAHNVNIMDAHGIIIASVDPARLGTLHDGAVRALERGDVVRIDADGADPDMREGVNVPFYLSDDGAEPGAVKNEAVKNEAAESEAVGVVGITGDPAVVEPLARILVLTVSLLLKQEQHLDDARWRESSLRDLLNAMIVDSRVSEARVVAMLRDVGRPIRPPWSIVTARSTSTGPAALGRFRNSVVGIGNVVAWERDTTLWLLVGSSDASTRAVVVDRLRTAGASVVTGRVGASTPELVVDVQQMDVLLRHHLPDGVVHELTALDIDILVGRQPEAIALDSARRIVGPLSDALRETAAVLIENNLSIVTTASALHTHRNTVVQRLNRIEQLTGLDLRVFDDAVAMKLALASARRVDADDIRR